MLAQMIASAASAAVQVVEVNVPDSGSKCAFLAALRRVVKRRMAVTVTMRPIENMQASPTFFVRVISSFLMTGTGRRMRKTSDIMFQIALLHQKALAFVQARSEMVQSHAARTGQHCRTVPIMNASSAAKTMMNA